MKRRHAGLAALMLGFVGCASAPTPTYYTLDVPGSDRVDSDSELRISLAEVALPDYARSNLLASADGPNRITLDDNHRWASAPSETLTHALATYLEQSLAATVLIQPHPRRFAPDVTVDVSLERFHRSASGSANLGGRVVVTGAGLTDVGVVRFAIDAPTAGADYADYVVSVQAALKRLAERIAAAITAMTAES